MHARTLSHAHQHMPTSATSAGETEPESALFFPRMDPATSSTSLITGRHRNNLSTLSLSSRFSVSANRVSTIEAYDLIYGVVPSSDDAVERLYEANAGTSVLLLSALFEADGYAGLLFSRSQPFLLLPDVHTRRHRQCTCIDEC